MKKELKNKLKNNLSTKKHSNHVPSNLPSNFLEEPGDYMLAYVSNSDRTVFIARKNGGKETYSRTIYPNGTYVETHSIQHPKDNDDTDDDVIWEVESNE